MRSKLARTVAAFPEATSCFLVLSLAMFGGRELATGSHWWAFADAVLASLLLSRLLKRMAT